MDLSFSYFFEQMMANPLLLMAVALTLGVILVNGWTDAPNAIATCVVTRCLSPRLAILMAAVFNFLGVFKLNIFKGAKSVKTENLGFFSSLIFGVVFSIGWTPCVGAFLGSALMLATSEGKVLTGVIMLLLYHYIILLIIHIYTHVHIM